MRPSSLSRLDWDFTAVPDDELFGCCLWEYARESNFIRRTLHSYREWFLSGGQRSEESERLFAATDRIQSIGDISEVIIRGCSFASNVAWQSKDEAHRPPQSQYRAIVAESPEIGGRILHVWE